MKISSFRVETGNSQWVKIDISSSERSHLSNSPNSPAIISAKVYPSI